MDRRVALILLLVLVVGGGLAIGYLTRPGAWYEELAKPSFTPPGWVFGPVWTALYVMIAIAGVRIMTQASQSLATGLWWAQLGLNFAWSPIFFLGHQIGLALAVILLLLATVLALIVVTWQRDRTTAWLLVPYAAWVAFACVLNASILARAAN